ncbi:MAG: hypothetical protein RLZZ161_1025, partial [Bacteroidota bacterium]
VCVQNVKTFVMINIRYRLLKANFAVWMLKLNLR